MTLHFIVHGRFSDRDRWHGLSFQETVIPSLNGEALNQSFRFTNRLWMCQIWQTDAEVKSLAIEDASLFTFGYIRLQITKHINNVMFSLFIKEWRLWCLVRSKNSPLVWNFWHWILIFPSKKKFFWSGKLKIFPAFFFLISASPQFGSSNWLTDAKKKRVFLCNGGH